MSKNTSISLGVYFEEFIKSKIKSGKYNSVSEVIREGLRLLEEKEKKTELLRKAIEIGESSGTKDDFDPDDHLRGLHEKYL